MSPRLRAAAALGTLLLLSAGIDASLRRPALASEAEGEMGASFEGESRSLDGIWSYHTGDLLPAAEDGEPWGSMPVPSNWFVEGLDHAGVVWFARAVDLPEPPARWTIAFEGVDYDAEVYWDGVRVGGHRGYFAPFRVELPPGGGSGHVLSVRVDSPKEAPADFSLHKRLIKGVLSHHDTRPGGAWSADGQDANTGGIWGHVRLIPAAEAALGEVQVTTLSVSPELARIRVEASALRLVSGEPVPYRVIDPDGRIAASGEIAPFAGGLSAELSIPRPELWWPREIGTPALYQLELGAQGAPGGDGRRTRFGIRTVTQDRARRIVINGRPVFLRGTNYIGSQYLASMTRELIARDLDLMQAAHINAVRVHAHVSAPELYAMADERGMLIWQDFPLQWGYDDSRAFAAEAARQAREMVESLYNHPSIIYWSGLNEAPFSSDWMVWKYADYDPHQNRLLDRTLQGTFESADPHRPSQGNAHPSEHAWSGWYEGSYRDFEKPTPHAIITEFGAQAVPAVETLRTFLGEGDLWPLTGKNLAKWEYHNFQLHELRDIARVPMGKSVEELVSNTQGYQARLTQFAAENLRRQKWEPVAGIFQFMFVEHWASINWGIVDYTRRPKAGYDTLARAYQPTLPMATSTAKRPGLSFFVVNDARFAFHGATLIARVLPARAGRSPRSFTVDVPENDVVRIDAALPKLAVGEALELELLAEDGSPLGHNAYSAGYFQ